MTEAVADAGARRPYHHGSLREALLRRAAEVIGAEGLDALSLCALARDLGVSHAAPARHFPTRNDLLAALAEDGVDKLIAETDAAVARTDPSPLAQLHMLALSYLRWAVEHPAQYNAVRNPEVIRHAGPRLRDKMAAFAARQTLALSRAQAAGWRRDADLDLLVFQFVATLVGSATLLSDPTYRSILGGVADADLIERIVADAFSVPPR